MAGSTTPAPPSAASPDEPPLSLALEQLEAKFVAAEGVISHTDLDLYSRGTSALKRVFEALGLRRRQKDVSPGSPGSALEARRAERIAQGLPANEL